MSRVPEWYDWVMAGTAKLDPRQFHLRMPDDLAEKIRARSAAKNITANDWIVRAALHALTHADSDGEPQPLRLPWSVLL